jgi:hypothetical protein|tara:strand:- start:502 stop:651 length:150 start_codon:yes stop_codon:yes gene_type:complete
MKKGDVVQYVSGTHPGVVVKLKEESAFVFWGIYGRPVWVLTKDIIPYKR